MYVKRDVREERLLLEGATDVPDAQERCGGQSHLYALFGLLAFPNPGSTSATTYVVSEPLPEDLAVLSGNDVYLWNGAYQGACGIQIAYRKLGAPAVTRYE
jgi:hypothetical protein